MGNVEIGVGKNWGKLHALYKYSDCINTMPSAEMGDMKLSWEMRMYALDDQECVTDHDFLLFPELQNVSQ